MLPDRFGTERLILRPIDAGDVGAIFAGYAQDPEVVRFLTFRPHSDRGDTETYIARCLATPASRARTYVLIGRADRRLLGAFELRRPEPHPLHCRYVLAPPRGGRRPVGRALSAGARWGTAPPENWRPRAPLA